jgi:regulator of PEP synthase PpsR (kinase-PPPase family)
LNTSPPEPGGNTPIFVISDGTGETAQQVVEACLVQFSDPNVCIKVFPSVKEPGELKEIMVQAKEQKAMLVATLVSADQRTEAERLAAKYRLPMVDVVGNMLATMSTFLRKRPKGMPGLLHMTTEAYFKRIDAVEFTVKADDGKEPRMLTEADIVLVGISRTSKTPLSVFLAHKGFKVGNVPIVLDREVPEQLWDVDPNRIFGLTINPASLQNIRKERLQTMRMSNKTNYGQLDYIMAELDFANDLFSRNREWPIIDVTNNAVEETAATIVKVLTDRGIAAPGGEVGQL